MILLNFFQFFKFYHHFSDFCEDSILIEKYKDFMENPSEAKKFVLDIGSYINEIGQKLKLMNKLIKSEYLSKNKFQEMQFMNEWKYLIDHENFNENEKLQEKFHRKLKKIVYYLEGIYFQPFSNISKLKYQNGLIKITNI